MKIIAWLLFFIVLWAIYDLRQAKTEERKADGRYNVLFMTILWAHASILSHL